MTWHNYEREYKSLFLTEVKIIQIWMMIDKVSLISILYLKKQIRYQALYS